MSAPRHNLGVPASGSDGVECSIANGVDLSTCWQTGTRQGRSYRTHSTDTITRSEDGRGSQIMKHFVDLVGHTLSILLALAVLLLLLRGETRDD